MKIYLASGSSGRRQLLKNAKIDFKIISHNYDEILKEKIVSVEDYVLKVARGKLENINFSEIKENFFSKFIVIVADTMCSFEDKEIIGKPVDFDEARNFFKKMNEEKFFYCSTALIVSVFEKKQNFELSFLEKFENVVKTKIFLKMDKFDIESYIEKKGDSILTYASGLDIEDFGEQFIEKIEGSYTGVIGLQMFELKQILEKIEIKYSN